MGKNLFKIYVLGNPLLEEDSLPLKLLPSLRKEFSDIEFIEIDPTEEFPEEEHLIIIDTIINTEKVVVLKDKDIDKIEQSAKCSLHDFDLGMQLKLMKKLGTLKEVTIIGVPPQIDEGKAVEGIKAILKQHPI